MAEKLSSRVGRIVSGSLNALVDAVENVSPETVMKEAIREVDALIDDVRAELGKVLAKKHLASTRLMDENRLHEELTSKIDLAVKENRDDLAEAAIARQLDIEAQIPVLERAIADCGDEEKEFEGFIAALQARKREMGEELAQFKVSNPSAAGQGGPTATTAAAKSPNIEARLDKATSAFDRVLEHNTGLAGRKGELKTGAQLAELDDLARRNRIEERLAAAKSGKAKA